MSVPTNVRRLRGPWDDGYALDLHTLGSTYLADDAYSVRVLRLLARRLATCSTS